MHEVFRLFFVNTNPAFISKENPTLFLYESAFEHSWESRTHSPDYLRGSPQFTTLMASVVLVRRLTGRGSYGLRIILQEQKSSGEVNAVRLWALCGTDKALCNTPHPTCKLCTLACLLGWLVGWCDKRVGWRDIKTPNWHKCQPQFLSARGRGFLVKWSSSTVRTLRDLVVFVRGKSIRQRQGCGMRALSGGKHEEVFYFDTTIREILFSPALAGRSESKISYLEVRPVLLGGIWCLAQGHYNRDDTWGLITLPTFSVKGNQFCAITDCKCSDITWAAAVEVRLLVTRLPTEKR